MSVGHRIPNACSISTRQLSPNESRLGRGNIIECLGHSEDRSWNRDTRRQARSHVAGKKARLLTATLFESGEEEGAIFLDGSTESGAILRAREGRISDWRERVSRLETSVAQESKDVSPIVVGTRLSDYIDNSASRAAKFRGIRICGYLKFLDGFLRHSAPGCIHRVVRIIRSVNLHQ